MAASLLRIFCGLLLAYFHSAISEGQCRASGDCNRRLLTANVQVLSDVEGAGSIVLLNVYLASGPPLRQGWKLCFTWTKAVVLQLPPGAMKLGSYVELPVQEALEAGEAKGFVLHLSPPAMRHASDLPQQLHVIEVASSNQLASGQLSISPVTLIPPVEQAIRFDDGKPSFAGLIPRPVEEKIEPLLAIDEGFILIPGLAGHVVIESRTPACKLATDIFQAWLLEWPSGSPLGLGAKEGRPARKLVLENISYAVDNTSWYGEEGYEVFIGVDVLKVRANTETGFLRGAASLRQLLGLASSEGRLAAPTALVRDRPRFRYRGLMLDCARHFFPVRFIKHILDMMFQLKLNVFHWHLTDDEGWRLQVRSLPNLTRIGGWRGQGEVIPPQYGGSYTRYGGFYSHEEIREIVSYAQSRGVDIVPEIDVPGHCYAAIQSLPELFAACRTSSATSVQGFQGNVLDPDCAATYEFLESVFTEVLDLFPAPLGVHIGMDEIPRKAWGQDPAESARLKAKLVGWLYRFLADRGKSLIGWEEVAHEDAGLDPTRQPTPSIVAWLQDERSAVTAANAGFFVICSPAHFLYLDIVQGLDYKEKGLYWSTTSISIERVYSYEPLERLRRLGLRVDAQILGVQASLWSEAVDSPARAEEMLFPRLLAAAETAWTGAQKKSWESFFQRLMPAMKWLQRDFGIGYGGAMTGLIIDGQFLRMSL